MLCIVARYAGRVLRFELPPGRVRFGSAPDNDLCIPFPGISRRHAQIERTEHGALIRDIGSKNLLVVNGVAVTMAELSLNATLRVLKLISSWRWRKSVKKTLFWESGITS